MTARCECGRPDWPGSCPGPANCPCVDNRPVCVMCEEPINDTKNAHQDYRDDWFCQDCHEAECEKQEYLRVHPEGEWP